VRSAADNLMMEKLWNKGDETIGAEYFEVDKVY
jgi:hypothetical protein